LRETKQTNEWPNEAAGEPNFDPEGACPTSKAVGNKLRMDRDKVVTPMIWNDITGMVERARTGDRAAYGELIERFQPTVYAVALGRLRNSTDAQELVQEVFLHAMTKLDQLRDPHCFAGWLRQITERMAINRLTRRGPVRGAEPSVLENIHAGGTGPLDDLLRTEQKAQLWEGLDRLKPTDRATLVAFYIRGRSLKQMSREFETPVGTIKRRLHVARNRLREHLEPARNRVAEPAYA
jgi:RNA polymerase sigma-70 factor (ECF subfamily)